MVYTRGYCPIDTNFLKNYDEFDTMFRRFRNLPKKTRLLLGTGILVAFVAALPLFIWGVTQLNFNIRERAGFSTYPFIIQEAFDGTGELDGSKWGHSGSVGATVAIESDKLKVHIPDGQDGAGGNDLVAFPYINSETPEIAGPFDASVDLVGLETNSGWQELRFQSTGSTVSIRRNKVDGLETIEFWSGSGSFTDTLKASASLASGSGSVRVRLVRSESLESLLEASYDAGAGFLTLDTISNTELPSLFETGTLPRLVAENGNPDYPETIAFFDNYYASVNVVIQETSSPSPTASPSPSPSGSPTAPPGGSPPPTVRPFEILLKFEGVGGNSAESAKVSARLVTRAFTNQTSAYVTPFLPVVHVGGGVYRLNFGVWSEELPPANDYAIIIKGERHLGIKYCVPSGQNGHCGGSDLGGISIPTEPSQKVSLDFSSIPLPAGDTLPQDGVVNLTDYERIKNLLSKPCSALTQAEKASADLNYDGCITTRDIFLIRRTLESRYDGG
jgi:hypothetical protein